MKIYNCTITTVLYTEMIYKHIVYIYATHSEAVAVRTKQTLKKGKKKKDERKLKTWGVLKFNLGN